MPSLALEAFKTLNSLFEQLEKKGFDADCDGHSLSFHLADGQPFLLNYHGTTQQIWLASPFSGAHHFRFQEGRWVSTRQASREMGDLLSLLQTELSVSLS